MIGKKSPFSDYDVVYHIAAIVHVKENDTEKYFNVNRDLSF
jgi:UDP-glucose 4-epimerase